MATTKEVEPLQEFNFKESKKRYLEQVPNPEVMGGPLSTREGIEKTINQIINGDKFVSDDKLVSEDLMVDIVDGQRKLFYKSKPRREVIPFDTAFDIVIDKHINMCHSVRLHRYAILKTKYFMPAFCVRIALDSCNVCNGNLIVPSTPTIPQVREIETQTTEAGTTTWRMNIIHFNQLKRQSEENNSFRHLLIFKENRTNFVLLRPITNQTEVLFLELMKICCEFGTPQRVVVPNRLKFYKDIFNSITTIRPEAEILVRQRGSHLFVKDKYEVLVELDKWRKDTKCNNWVIGSHIVQFRLNTTLKFIKKIGQETGGFIGVPYNLFFGNEANVYKTIHTRKEWTPKRPGGVTETANAPEEENTPTHI